ncbi:MAG: ClpV1 family T6SS ATPase [Lysobacterales bacterium 69-70]|nr:type VI secretion system ATPase TssH [Xanthomonadaceae bacterium]ODU32730.1 MAG: ClpV1 family T6SS ATPase [Xanthomonadaceae bacterium SCN 69-320]ODV15689.1 MAG: ClpV1 family T6SS ATPase [Xanthomonadaceae bacterium SCN 69-25]OJY99860.1 MAG: ClpV1 family T6SS ATPase [Xanthomonadales bacterium 69-70]
MSEISRTALFGKLNPLLYKGVEGAAVFCKLRGNPYVELVHWLHQLLQNNDSDLHRIIRHYQLDAARLAADMVKALDRLPGGATAISDLSDHLQNAVERGWVYATLMFNQNQVRGATLLLGILKTTSLRTVLYAMSKEFQAIDPDKFSNELAKVVAGSPEDEQGSTDGSGLDASGGPGEVSGAMAPAQLGRQEALRKFAVDLTERARNGEIDPITGRDDEIRQIIDILMRRRQNNPLLTGEAGVGKTAVVEGFAVRIASGDVPPQLQEVSLLMLDIGLLQAGASMKGEFEQRLRQIIDEVQASPKPIILFIDEVHTLIGAGGAAGTGDAANLLKPALARGTLRTIGATTWSEYKKHIEKDPALTRRFQVVQVGEPDEDKAIAMVRGIVAILEKHHRITLLDEAVTAAVRLSHRYIPARQLPDKAVSLLDTACARVAVSQHTTPAELEDCTRRIEVLRTEQGIIEREDAVGLDVAERRERCESRLAAELEREQALRARWEQENELATRLLDLRTRLRELAAAAKAAQADGSAAAPAAAVKTDGDALVAPTPDRAFLLAEHAAVQAELDALQGESPLILPAVDETAVASVVADWTGIPVGRMVRNEITAVLQLVDTLDKRVVGQRHALELITKRIQTARARLDNPNKPIGVFMLVGPSGVGKTETALALAESLYGGEQNLITINMSEFQEAHTVSTLKGAPPGYVGYGEGGVLTEAVRRKPYSVVLLDEVEKAHSDVHELFFQVFDKGWMEDGEGRAIDFRNTIILLTSNVGTDLVMKLTADPELSPEPEALNKALREPLLQKFPPAFLGRLVTIPYYPLANDTLARIVRLQLGRIQKRIAEQHGIDFGYGDDAVQLVIKRCTEVESGGRMIDAILTHTVLPTVSREFLSCLADGRKLASIRLETAGDDFAYRYGYAEDAVAAAPATA